MYRSTGLPSHWSVYREISNCLRASTRKDRQSFVNKMTTDIKLFCRWIRSLIIQTNILPEIHYKNKVVETDSEKAEAFE